MLLDKAIEITINSNNREKYEKVLSLDLVNGQTVMINQHDVLPTSRTIVECECDMCGKTFTRMRKDVKERTYCGKECRNQFLIENNPNPKKDKVKLSCSICGTSLEVVPSKLHKQDVFMCSRECYAEHRRKNFTGGKTYNYQNIFVFCENCGERIKTTRWYIENKKHQFCTPECYWKHRKSHYREFYYSPALNNSREETVPERMVREWLEKENVNFKTEAGFLRKYFVDFYLKDYKTIIEVYGDYWHVNPEVYDTLENDNTKKKMNDYQKEWVTSNYDEKRKQDLESYGFTVEILWERDIHSSLDEIMERVMHDIRVRQNTNMSLDI